MFFGITQKNKKYLYLYYISSFFVVYLVNKTELSPNFFTIMAYNLSIMNQNIS